MNENDSVLEPEILEAYRGLGTPVSAPDDVLAQVGHRIRRRRTARRGVVALAAVAVAGGLGVQTLGGDDSEGGDRVAADPGPRAETSTLTYTDTDGSRYTFDAADIEVTCPAPVAEDHDRQHLLLSRADGKQPVLYVDLIVDKVTPGQVFPLPYDVDGGSDKLPMIFFFTAGLGDGANELGSNMGGSTGTVTVHEASCGPEPSLWIEIDGKLGSEVEQPALAITGEYRS